GVQQIQRPRQMIAGKPARSSSFARDAGCSVHFAALALTLAAAGGGKGIVYSSRRRRPGFTSRFVTARSKKVQARALDRPAWLPGEDSLRALAAGEKLVGFFCLREVDSSNNSNDNNNDNNNNNNNNNNSKTAICACEVRPTIPATATATTTTTPAQDGYRSFHFETGEPGGLWRFSVRELPFSEGKLGGHLWDGGILMAAWALAADGGAELFRGRRVLELGSGIGLLGVALAGSIAGSVVLTDFGFEEVVDGAQQEDSSRLIPPKLLRNLKDNVSANGLENAEVWRIDWHDFLTAPHPALEPIERFERLVAADVVYYASDLPALAASVAAHLLPGGRERVDGTFGIGKVICGGSRWRSQAVRRSAGDLVYWPLWYFGGPACQACGIESLSGAVDPSHIRQHDPSTFLQSRAGNMLQEMVAVARDYDTQRAHSKFRVRGYSRAGLAARLRWFEQWWLMVPGSSKKPELLEALRLDLATFLDHTQDNRRRFLRTLIVNWMLLVTAISGLKECFGRRSLATGEVVLPQSAVLFRVLGIEVVGWAYLLLVSDKGLFKSYGRVIV
ncbi:unnamed protein product, partial [Polarella glacialis]